jgi:hypothetical protein
MHNWHRDKLEAMEKYEQNFDIDLSDLKLDEDDFKFLDKVVEKNFQWKDAISELYNAPDEIAIKNIADRYRHKKVIREALRRFKMVYESATDWNFKKSTFYAQICFNICLNVVRDETKTDKERMSWMKRAEFWKENLDKIHGYYKESVPEREPPPKEITEYSDDQLHELVGLIEDAEYKLLEKNNGESS